MTDKQFAAEIRATLARHKRLVAAQAGLVEVRVHWRRPHGVRAHRVRGHWVRRIGQVPT